MKQQATFVDWDFVNVWDDCGGTTFPILRELQSCSLQAPTILWPADGTVTDDNVLTLSGTAQANTTVEIFDGAASLGIATAYATGNWSFTTAVLADGLHTFTATATDALGNTSPASAAVNVTVGTTRAFNYTITAIGTQTTYPNQSFDWWVLGIGTEEGVWDSSYSENVYCGGRDLYCTDYLSAPSSITSWSRSNVRSKNGGYEVWVSQYGGELRVDTYSGGGTHCEQVCTFRFLWWCWFSEQRCYEYYGYYAANYTINFLAQLTARVYATQSGTSIVNAAEGDKIIGTVPPLPTPHGGTIRDASYMVWNTNPNVSTFISGSDIKANTRYAVTLPWTATESGSGTVNTAEGNKYIATSPLVAPAGDTKWAVLDDNPGVATWMVGNELRASVIINPPMIAINRLSAPEDGPLPLQDVLTFPATVGSQPVTVEVAVGDTVGINSVIVNGVSAVEGPNNTWTAVGVPLYLGANSIIATAIDSSGNVGEDAIQVTLDLDLDGDGIRNNLDKAPPGPFVASNEFSDEALGGSTSGTITDRGNQLLTIVEEPNPAGVRIKTDVLGGEPAAISICGGASQFSLDANEEVLVTCSSVTIEVISGTVEVTFVADDGTIATSSLNAGNTLIFEPATPGFTAPSTNPDTVVILIEGEELYSAPGEEVIVNEPPTAEAGPDQIIELTEVGASVTLDGSGSSDPDEDPLTYTWTGPFFEGGGTVTDINPTVTLPSLGSHTITLTVDDGKDGTDTDTVTITVVDTTPPILTVPAGSVAECDTAGGANASNAQIQAFLDSASAGDIVDPAPTISNDSPSFYPLGDTSVTFIATDASGNSTNTASVVTVQDTISPTLFAEWVPLKVQKSEGEFQLEFHAEDVCDPAAQTTGVVETPALDGLEVELKTEPEIKVKFDLKKGKVEISGPDPQALLAQLQELGGLVVDSGQLVKVNLKEAEEGKQQFKFEGNGELKIEAPSAVLRVTGEDASGNAPTVQVSPQFASEDD